MLIFYGAASIPENKGQSLVKTEEKMARRDSKTETHNNWAFENETKI